MIMKRLIAISVVFALVAGAAFAVDLGGDVIGTVNFLEGSNAEDNYNGATKPIGASAEMNRVRIQGEAANDEGTFGGWVRLQADTGTANNKPWETGFDAAAFGYAWWKPIDQFKVWIGGNGGDGFFGKEGNTAWMFYQTVSDTGVVNPAGAWDNGGSYYKNGLVFRNAFYGGGLDGQNAVYMTISPLDILAINIEIPFFDAPDANDSYYRDQGRAKYIWKHAIFQADVKLDFGNIALTYVGNEQNYDFGGFNSGSKLFAYFGLTSIENLAIDVGLGFQLPVTQTEEKGDETYKTTVLPPVSLGLGAKFTSGAFGVKVRAVASFAGNTSAKGKDAPDKPGYDEPFKLNADILPFFSLNDSMTIFFSAGLGITGKVKEDEDWGIAENDHSIVGWHINPYVQIGQEWGPKFVAGVKLWSAGAPDKDTDAVVSWSVPIAISVGF